MSHWAEINDDGVVVNVAIGNDSEPNEGESFFQDVVGGNWAKTSINTRGGVHYDPETGEPSEDQSKALRFNYAGIGFTYDAERDAFIPPKNFNSWILNENTCLWEAPIPYPEDGGVYIWDEESTSWQSTPTE
jgi:hypothetical protein